MKKAIFLFLFFLYSCYSPEELSLQNIKFDFNKTIYIDNSIHFTYVPYKMKQWISILQLKPQISWKIQDYFKKMKWTVTNYHYKTNQSIKLIPYPMNSYKRPISYSQWLSIRWKTKKQLNTKEVKALLKSKYMLVFLYYPDPKNLLEFKLEIYFAKLLPPFKIKELLEKKKYKISMEDYWKMFDRVKKIEKPLLFMMEKAEGFISTAVILALKENGLN